jgi:hypothetical protein
MLWLVPALATAALVLGCGSKKPPQAPEPEPSAPVAELEERAPPPPKKKKCESLDEACKALAGTKAKILRTPFTFDVAVGWLYAQHEPATLAQASGVGPVLAAAAIGGDPKKELAEREAALEVVANEAGISLPKKKVQWKKPQDKKDVHGLKVRMWQVDGATRGDKKGPLLVFDATSSDGKALVGLGFVPADDSTNADEAIMQSIESLEGGQ